MRFQKFVKFVEELAMSTYQDLGILAPIAMVKDQSILKHLNQSVMSACFIHPEKGLWETPKGKKYWNSPINAKRAWTVHNERTKKHWSEEGYTLVSTTYSRNISFSHRD